MEPRTRGLRRRVAGDHHLDRRRRPDQPLRAVRRGRPRRRARKIRRAQSTDAATGKRGKPSGRALRAYFAARDWDAMAEMLADDISIDDRRRVVNAGIRHGRDAEIANMRAVAEIGVQDHDIVSHCDPRGAPRPQPYPLLRPQTSGPRRSTPRCSASSRSTPTPDRGARRVRPRRHRRCLRGTRRPIPRRRSGRPRADVVGHRTRLTPRSTDANFRRQRRTGSPRRPPPGRNDSRRVT